MFSKKHLIVALFAASMLLSACFPTPAAEEGGISASEAEKLVETAVAQALDAKATEDAEAAAAAPQATATLAPVEEASATPAPVQPTATLIPTITPIVLAPTTAPVGGGGSIPTAVPDYGCLMTVRKPADGTVMGPGSEFDIKWTVENTGTLTWYAGYDFRHQSGDNFALTTFSELPNDVKPGETFSFVLDAKAPAHAGTYTTVWALESSSCYVYASIVVE